MTAAIKARWLSVNRVLPRQNRDARNADVAVDVMTEAPEKVNRVHDTPPLMYHYVHAVKKNR